MNEVVKKSIPMPGGRDIELETGRLARQADGSIVLTCGKTMLLATVVSAQEAKEGVDFMPLTVNYQEKFAASGKIPGGFFKREGRPSTREILISRLIDRALRPLFPEDYHADTFVDIFLISADMTIRPDALAALAASAALAVSDIPIAEPISEVRVAKINDEFIVNPTFEQMEDEGFKMSVIVAGTQDNIMMVEGEMNEVSEEELIQAIQTAHETIKVHCQVQREMTEAVGKTVKRTYQHEAPANPDLKAEIENTYLEKIYEVVRKDTTKQERNDAFQAMADELIEQLEARNEATESEEEKVDIFQAKQYFGEIKKKAIRKLVLQDKTRLDGRRHDEIRPINCEINYLPAAHGSAVFTRGETQSLTTVTLGNKMDEQMIDSAMSKSSEKFILHYNFPPFSTGDARPSRGPGRREIGHGNLALRAVKPILPDLENNPYTIRVVSDILESNGSSSMATVCASSLALMDAGVHVKKAVSGIAMGLIAEGDDYAILSDILGDEDHIGDMDFKVTGTKDGITACQMDIKVDGLSYEVLAKALHQAREGRLHILNVMNETISEYRSDYKEFVPRIEVVRVDKEFIGAIIGPGGKNIQKLQEDTNTNITIDEVDGVGMVEIMSDDKSCMAAAKNYIERLIMKPEEGKVYDGVVKSIMDFGAFVEILPGKDGLLHISEIAWNKTASVSDVLEEGQQLKVKLKSIDEKTGKMSLTLKELLPKPEGYVEPPKRSRSGGGNFNRNKGGQGRGDRDRNRNR